MQFLSGPDPTDLLTLPWSTPLVDWPPELMISLPRGISRHIVRFVRLGGVVYAVKEMYPALAEQEYVLLRELRRRQIPSVTPMGVVSDRRDGNGQPLDAALVTKHLRFSLPYRALFSRRLDPDLEGKVLDSLAELLVKLHLSGFAWRDCSLSNTLFRRDAGALSAYLVDAETGELREQLSRGQRLHDLDIAETNLAGELLDIQMAGLLPEQVDPVDTALSVLARYEALWTELTAPQTLGSDEWWRVEHRVRRLNDLGYDVAQIDIDSAAGEPNVLVQTQVVEAGHHRRRLFELTGLDVQENQARRILNDLDSYRSRAVMPATDVDEFTVARHWMTDVFEPVIEQVPRSFHDKLEDAEIFHEVLEHRWFLSESAGREVSLDDATLSYLVTVLAHRPDEQALLDPDLMGMGETLLDEDGNPLPGTGGAEDTEDTGGMADTEHTNDTAYLDDIDSLGPASADGRRFPAVDV